MWHNKFGRKGRPDRPPAIAVEYHGSRRIIVDERTGRTLGRVWFDWQRCQWVGVPMRHHDLVIQTIDDLIRNENSE